MNKLRTYIELKNEIDDERLVERLELVSSIDVNEIHYGKLNLTSSDDYELIKSRNLSHPLIINLVDFDLDSRKVERTKEEVLRLTGEGLISPYGIIPLKYINLFVALDSRELLEIMIEHFYKLIPNKYELKDRLMNEIVSCFI